MPAVLRVQLVSPSLSSTCAAMTSESRRAATFWFRAGVPDTSAPQTLALLVSSKLRGSPVTSPSHSAAEM
jgi:hypothetical protein